MIEQIEIKRIPAIRAATVVAFTMISIAIVMSIIYLFLLVCKGTFNESPLLLIAIWTHAGYAWVGTAILVAMYNIVAGKYGGIKLNVERIEKK